MGGVMLQSAEWLGGLHDPELPVSAEQRQAVELALQETIRTVMKNAFPYHGIAVEGAESSGGEIQS